MSPVTIANVFVSPNGANRERHAVRVSASEGEMTAWADGLRQGQAPRDSADHTSLTLAEHRENVSVTRTASSR